MLRLLFYGLTLLSDASGSSLASELALLRVDPRQILIKDGVAPYASRYPATIRIAGLPTAAAKVAATVHGLESSHVVDINLQLLGPNGNSVTLMSHAGGNSAVNALDLTFDDDGGTLPQGGLLTSGLKYRPGSYAPPFSMPSPAPAPTHATLQAAFGGDDPNGVWSLFVCDDHREQIDSPGAIVGSWSLNISPPLDILEQPAAQVVPEGGTAVFRVRAEGVEPLTYEWYGPNGLIAAGEDATLAVSPVNCEAAGAYRVFVRDSIFASVESQSAQLTVLSTPKSILDNYKAAPYPAEYCVSGYQSSISKVTVTINHFKHPRARDVNLVLVGPNNNAVTLMSHASGGQTPVQDLTITFDDNAANTLPDSNSEFPASASQAYKPSGSLTLAPPQPAPNPTHSTLGEAFGGQDPNGPWKLYIFDDATGPCSTLPAEIESWSLSFTPRLASTILDL
jgi:subtilisin-like proprotein convertase family protein